MFPRLASTLLLALPLGAPAQPPRPEVLPPTPRTEQEQKDLDARRLYAEGVLHVKRGVFLDAVRAFEACLKLDPDALPPRRMLATHYLTVGRPDEALAMARAVVDKAPEEFDGWQVYAGQLRDLGRKQEARQALTRATELESAARYPEQLLLLLKRLSEWSRDSGDWAGAAKALERFLGVLEKNHERFRDGGFLEEENYVSEQAAGWERLGEAQMALERLDEALKSFERARAAFAGRDDVTARLWQQRAHWHLARVESARKDYPAALEHLQTYLKNVTPGSLEPYRLLADVLIHVDPAAAGRRLAELIRDEKNLPLQLLVAETCVRAGRDADGEEQYLKLARTNPNPDVYRGLFQIYERTGRAGDALRRLDEHCAIVDEEGQNKDKQERAQKHVRAMTAALVKQPGLILKMLPLADEERWRQLMNKQRYRTFERLAYLALYTDRLPEAERLLREAQHGRRRFLRASIDEALIRVLMAQHKYEDVRSLCRERLQNANDEQFLYHFYLDQALMRLGELDEALRVNEQTIALAFSESNKFAAREHRVEILHQAGRSADALAECEKLLKDLPQARYAPAVRHKMAAILSHERKFAESETILRQLLEADPNDVQTLNTLGYELADQNRRLDEAERLVRRALELDRRARQFGDDAESPADDEDNPAYLDSLAWVLFRKGQLAEGRKLLEEATTRRGGRDEPTLWDHLGDIHYRLGDVEKARAAWQKALEYYAREPLAKKDGRLGEVARKLNVLK